MHALNTDYHFRSKMTEEDRNISLEQLTEGTTSTPTTPKTSTPITKRTFSEIEDKPQLMQINFPTSIQERIYKIIQQALLGYYSLQSIKKKPQTAPSPVEGAGDTTEVSNASTVLEQPTTRGSTFWLAEYSKVKPVSAPRKTPETLLLDPEKIEISLRKRSRAAIDDTTLSLWRQVELLRRKKVSAAQVAKDGSAQDNINRFAHHLEYLALYLTSTTGPGTSSTLLKLDNKKIVSRALTAGKIDFLMLRHLSVMEKQNDKELPTLWNIWKALHTKSCYSCPGVTYDEAHTQSLNNPSGDANAPDLPQNSTN